MIVIWNIKYPDFIFISIREIYIYTYQPTKNIQTYCIKNYTQKAHRTRRHRVEIYIAKKTIYNFIPNGPCLRLSWGSWSRSACGSSFVWVSVSICIPSVCVSIFLFTMKSGSAVHVVVSSSVDPDRRTTSFSIMLVKPIGKYFTS